MQAIDKDDEENSKCNDCENEEEGEQVENKWRDAKNNNDDDNHHIFQYHIF